nr:RNA-binding domain-containing protein [uncultured Sphaerochaeta sp.]
MLKSEILEIISNGENSGIEFKRDDIRPEQLAKEIVALVNFQGGRILLGVEDDGAISGVQRENAEEWVMNVVRDKVHPSVLPNYEKVKIDEEHYIAVLTFFPGISKPYVVRYSGREDIYIRVGSTSQIATREHQMLINQSGEMLHTEVLPVPGTSFENLDLSRLENYLRDIIKDPMIPETREAWINRAMGLGFLTEASGERYCTIAGLVLFGKTPRRFLRQAGLRIFGFASEDKEFKALFDQILDAPLVGRWDMTGSERTLIDPGLIERCIEVIRPFISEESDSVDQTLRRNTHWFYPLEAIREVFINALAHRDWTRFVEIEIGIYIDRLEVISPGALPNSMTIEKMISGQRLPRNLIIAEVLRDYGYVDNRGMGVRTKVIPLMKAQNTVEPVFDANEDYLKTVLYRKKEAE